MTTEPACYVYGIVRQDAAEPATVTGVGDPPAPVGVVRHGALAAIVSDVPVGPPLGTPDDLRAHVGVLNGFAERGPVLPLRFGAVVRDGEAVAAELLGPHEEEFLQALERLGDTAQYTVRGAYLRNSVLREVLADREDLAQLRADIAAVPEEASYYDRVRLGEEISREVTARRSRDAALVAERLEPFAVAVQQGPVAAGDQAVNVSFLVTRRGRDAFEAAAEELAESWAGRVGLRLLGPLAPFDFVTAVVDRDGAGEGTPAWD